MDDKPLKLKLKVAWFKNVLGIAIDQASLHQQYSLTPYYFWPRTEAWEQLRLELELKPWIQKEEKIKVLNSAAKLMNFCMQEYRNTESIEIVKNHGGVKYAKSKMEELRLKAIEIINKFDDSETKHSLIELTNYMITRKK